MSWTTRVERLDLHASPTGGYELLDSGGEERLERFGGRVLRRPCGQAIWSRRLPETQWDAADATFSRHANGSGEWSRHGKMPESWMLTLPGLELELRLTGFGNIGFFAEQLPCWSWVGAKITEAGRPLSVLNLFAYTGSMTLAAAAAGAQVCHLDAVRAVVSWARKNAEASGLGERPIRWITEDVMKFVGRERRRRSQYDGIILDPPSFGRGRQGQVFKLERDLPELIESCRELLTPDARFLFLTCHTPGITGVCLANLLHAIQKSRGGRILCGELLLVPADPEGTALPAGQYACWTREAG